MVVVVIKSALLAHPRAHTSYTPAHSILACFGGTVGCVSWHFDYQQSSMYVRTECVCVLWWVVVVFVALRCALYVGIVLYACAYICYVVLCCVAYVRIC